MKGPAGMIRTAITIGIACFLAAASANAENIRDLRDGGAGNSQPVAGDSEVHLLTLAKKFQLTGALLLRLDQNIIYDIRYGYNPCDVLAHEKPGNEAVWQDVKAISRDDKSGEWKARTYEIGQGGDRDIEARCKSRFDSEQYVEPQTTFFLGLDRMIDDVDPARVFVIETRRSGRESN